MAAGTGRVCTWYIRHVDLFRGLAQRDADDFARAMTRKKFSAGQLIVGPETQPEVVFVTRAGTVRLFYTDDEGQDTTVDRLDAGHLFGVTGYLSSEGGALLAEAETDVVVCQVEGRRFLDVVARWPSAALELALRLGVRVLDGEAQLTRITATGARARLAAVLYRLARDGSETQPGGGVRLRSVPRHAALADEIGTSRETVTRMLARLEKDGYIRRFGKQIVVPDAARLANDFDLGA
jgi:CRP/FNR family cyclic AMP-dependent transcriptional regulator